ncbi:hypothetical protein [Chryseobacterium sp. Mn2064]|uniref:hypothetical protein n=1 Tax=Chryseobacterium sp. Mn2064 TaxID=3395263 RepID=UPI003BDD56DB
MIKNKAILLWGMLLFLFFQNTRAQRANVNFGEFSNPVPSVSSLASYNNLPQSNATGIPEISIPLLQLPSNSKDIQLGVSLSYNLLNIKSDEPASDIGTGWSLFSGGVISRSIVGELDERNYDVTLNGYERNEFDDIYYYNIPGASGKFRFVRNTTNNTFQLINLSANKVKIEYTRTSNTVTLILNSFTITDAKGNKFFFNDYSLANLNGELYGGSNEYRSAFFITKIINANNIEIANFTYEKKSKNKFYLPSLKIYEYCKLKSIISPGFGRIEYDYIFNESWKMNDPFQVQKIVLKDQYGHVISGYSFDYTYFQYPDGQLAGGSMDYIYKRALQNIKKLDKNSTVFETTELTYNYAESDPPLKRIITSMGIVQYDFDEGKIAAIKYYESRTGATPIKTVRYDYSSFVDPNVSSGKTFLTEMALNYDSSYKLYKNVKIIEDNNGYTKYYYKTPDDSPEVSYTGGAPNDKFWPHYSILSGGLLEKKEVYDDQNKLLLSELNNYVFEDAPGPVDYKIFDITNNGYKTYSKNVWPKKFITTSTAYFENGRNVQETSETDYSSFNFQPVLTKKTVDGRTEEQINTYPESGYANLSAAHILNTPVIVEGKIDGKLVSRVETKFENAASTFPTAITTSNIGNTAQKTATIDLYDEKGNILQYTDANGNVATTIYGYNKTLPIAKIEGASYAQVSSLVQTIINASDADAADPSTESQLLTALDSFRNNAQLKDFQINTYTYDPLIGATTITTPNGIREIYKYDIQNRLKEIQREERDANGNISYKTLKEYQYHLKN